MAFLRDTIPAWFKSTPLFTDLMERERTKHEAHRSTLARERAALLAQELKAAPKRQRELDAADAKLRTAEAAFDVARREHATTTARLRADAVGPSTRLNAIDGELRRLADPCIENTLIAIEDQLDALRRPGARAFGRADAMAALRRARTEINALYERADVDAQSECARIMAEASALSAAAA